MLSISGSWNLFVSAGCTVYNMSIYSGESLFMTQRIICSAESLFDMVGEVFFHVFKFGNSKTSVKSLHFE